MNSETATPAIKTPRKPHAQKSKAIARVRRTKLVRAVLRGESPKDAAIALGLSPKTAVQQSSMILNHPESKQMFADIMERAGLSDKVLAEKLRTLLDAKQTIFFQHQGHVVDERVIEHLECQRKSLELASRLKGHLQESKASPDITINIMGAVINALRADQD